MCVLQSSCWHHKNTSWEYFHNLCGKHLFKAKDIFFSMLQSLSVLSQAEGLCLINYVPFILHVLPNSVCPSIFPICFTQQKIPEVFKNMTILINFFVIFFIQFEKINYFQNATSCMHDLTKSYFYNINYVSHDLDSIYARIIALSCSIVNGGFKFGHHCMFTNSKQIVIHLR